MIKRIMNDPLVRGSIVLVVAFGAFSFLNFLFHLIMARALDTSEYGTLATLFSLIYLASFFSESIQTVMTKYSAMQKNERHIWSLFEKSNRKALRPAVALFVIYIVASFFFSHVLDISIPLLLVNGLMIFATFYSPIARGILQGRKRFGALGLNMVIEGAAKIAVASFLVWIGWRTYGAVTGTFVGAVLAYIVAISIMKRQRGKGEEPAEVANIQEYSKSTFFAVMGLMTFYSLDIILAKVFFDSQTAGVYSIVSVLAKTIFLGTQPISKAMFPLASDSLGNTDRRRVLVKSLALLTPMIIFALAIFYFFPDLLIRIFSGRVIPEGSGIVFILGVAASLLSIANLFLLYSLSYNKTEYSSLIAIPVIIQIALFAIFSSDIVQFANAFAIASLVMVIVTFVMALLSDRKKSG